MLHRGTVAKVAFVALGLLLIAGALANHFYFQANAIITYSLGTAGGLFILGTLIAAVRSCINARRFDKRIFCSLRKVLTPQLLCLQENALFFIVPLSNSEPLMFKSIFLTATLLLASLAHANFFCGDNPGIFCGDCVQYYAGVTGGVGILGGEYTVTDNSGVVESASNSGVTGLIGGVAGLQSYLFDPIYLAFQINGLYNTCCKTVISSDSHGIELINNFQWGIDARVGWNICCDVAPYALVGFESGRWRMRLINNSLTNDRGIPPQTAEAFAKTLYGPKVGAGFTFPICCCLNANIEYSYVWFGRFRKNLFNSGVKWKHNERVNQNSVLVGINYLF